MSLYFPRFDGPAVEDRVSITAAVATPVAGGERLLVVEDETGIRQLLLEVLREEGYEVMEATDGESAMRLLRSGQKIDLLLTDVGLPGGMNGRQVADAARVFRPGLKSAVLTGYAENADDWSRHLQADMHVMTKPFDIPELMGRVRGILA